MSERKRNAGGPLAMLTAGVVSLGLLAGMASQGQAQEMKKVRIGVATTFLGITYPWLMMPQALGYWKEEGYDVEVLPIGGSLQVVQQMVGGGVEIGQMNAAVVVQSRAMNNIPIRAFMTNGIIDWALTVPEDSAIKDVGDLKGKKIGVFNLASGGIPFLKSYLSNNGIDPESDVQLIAVGFGASAVQALKGDQVDALFFWASANAGYENSGVALRHIKDPAWADFPDFSMTALDSTIGKDSAMLEAIARGAAKASLFAMTNPDCVRQIQWKTWPDTKPTGADDATLAKWDLNSLQAQLDSMQAAHDMNDSKLWGQTSVAGFQRMEDLLKGAGLIDKVVPAEDLVLQDQAFYERVNDFDHEAVIKSAKDCKF